MFPIDFKASNAYLLCFLFHNGYSVQNLACIASEYTIWEGRRQNQLRPREHLGNCHTGNHKLAEEPKTMTASQNCSKPTTVPSLKKTGPPVPWTPYCSLKTKLTSENSLQTMINQGNVKKPKKCKSPFWYLAGFRYKETGCFQIHTPLPQTDFGILIEFTSKSHSHSIWSELKSVPSAEGFHDFFQNTETHLGRVACRFLILKGQCAVFFFFLS